MSTRFAKSIAKVLVAVTNRSLLGTGGSTSAARKDHKIVKTSDYLCTIAVNDVALPGFVKPSGVPNEITVIPGLSAVN